MNDVVLASALTVVVLIFMILELRQRRRDHFPRRLLSQLTWIGGLVIVWALASQGRLTSALVGMPLVVFTLNLIKIYGLRQKAKES